MKLMLSKLIILFIFSVTPLAWANPESNQIKMTEPFNMLYPPFHVEFKGKTGTVFIGNYGKKVGKTKGIYFLANNGNELHYIDYVYFEEILGIFKIDFLDPSMDPDIIIFGRNKEDSDMRHGFDYKYMQTNLEYENNKLSLTYTPVLAFERGGCFDGTFLKEQRTCSYKGEKELRADISKMYNPKPITNLATVDISKRHYFIIIKTPKTYLYSSPMEKSKTKMYLVLGDKAYIENIQYDKGLVWILINYQTPDSKVINKWLKAQDIEIYKSAKLYNSKE